VRHLTLIACVCTALSAAALTGYRAATHTPHAPDNRAKIIALDTLLDLQLSDSNGQTHSLTPLRGQIRVINWWATWCAPCRDEMPAFARLQARYQSRGVHFIGLAFDDAAHVREFAHKTPVNYPLLIAPSGLLHISTALGNHVQALPFTVILDRHDRIVARQLGPYPEAALETLLNSLL
jgi:peroxiredoxin